MSRTIPEFLRAPRQPLVRRAWFRCRRCNTHTPFEVASDVGLNIRCECGEGGVMRMKYTSMEAWNWLGFWKRTAVTES